MQIKFLVDSIYAQLCLGLTTIACWCHVIGFFTPFWFNGPMVTAEFAGFVIKTFSGLWKGCDETGTLCFIPKGDGTGWFEAVQAFETLGFIAGIVALILIILYVFVPATSGKKIVSILSMLAAFAAAGCIILGIIIYGAKSHDLSWSFALCTIGGVLFGIAGLLLAIDMMKR